ncbi:tRNA uridine-5-carboxymethylaminomethyl(34) synthesis GTPase MnmE [Caulobacter sp. KR2-114]|uniref:tRNA uridine-5-carboxymethylaminomethyl(34) synthesis GTPase MnmE n=1 Tax=Caulobacter sp. KR2-114 TaxID=3400912 RepID=UPI003BFEC0AE
MTDTIFAPATAPGRAAVAVVRISGPATAAALAALGLRRPPGPRRAALRTLRSPQGAVIDRGLVLWFPGPSSYTGEDSAELHLHGGLAVVAAATQALLDSGLRLAEPGEFTRRAFENGRLDLDQAEAVADLVDAETDAQARQALGQLEGALGERYDHWRRQLIEALAQLEAAVDFPDEDVPADVAARAREPIEALLTALEAALADEARGRRIRDGYRIAIIGAPNAGKSSLFNALLGRDAAIVTPIPGATRDVIEAPLVLSGYKVLLADMAGLRDTVDPVEVEGVRRARAWAAEADLRLWLVDGSASDGAWRLAADLLQPRDMVLLNKADLAEGADAAAVRAAAPQAQALSVSAGGVAGLLAGLSDRVTADLSGAEFPAVTRARHRGLLEAARDHLRRALGSLEEPELAAEDVRLAARALGRVAGRIGAEDVLDLVFASFCIGK